MGTITTQYAVGDSVFVLTQVREEVPVDCDICRSTGKVTLSDREFRCPACGGQTVKSEQSEVVAVSATVLRVQASACTDTCSVKYTLNVGYGVVRREETEVYASEAAARAALGV